MALRPKGSSKPKSQKNVDDEQSRRFIETARALGVDETGKEFEAAFSKIVPPRRKKRNKSAT